MHSYVGYCRTKLDCVVLFEAAKQGRIPTCKERLSVTERENLQSGYIYIWDEGETGIKRWTDGKLWSTSRVYGQFLVYRELDYVEKTVSSSGCRIKPHGLCKQASNVMTSGESKLHMIGYYTKEDLRLGRFLQPSMDATFEDIVFQLKTHWLTKDVNTEKPTSEKLANESEFGIQGASLSQCPIYGLSPPPDIPLNTHPCHISTQPATPPWDMKSPEAPIPKDCALQMSSFHARRPPFEDQYGLEGEPVKPPSAHYRCWLTPPQTMIDFAQQKGQIEIQITSPCLTPMEHPPSGMPSTENFESKPHWRRSSSSKNSVNSLSNEDLRMLRLLDRTSLIL